MKGKRGDILTENVVFIVITLLFISMLFVFVAKSSSTIEKIEESQAKKLALIIDSAMPGTTILLNFENIFSKKSAEISEDDAVAIAGNMITVKLSQKSGSSYGFFNDVDAKVSSAAKEGKPGFIKLVISEKQATGGGKI